MEVTIHKRNIPVLLHVTSKICSNIILFCTFFNTVVDVGTDSKNGNGVVMHNFAKNVEYGGRSLT